MPKVSFTQQLKTALQEDYDLPSHATRSTSKKNVMMKIQYLESQQREKLVLRALKSLYTPVTKSAQKHSRTVLLEQIQNQPQENWLTTLVNNSFVFTRKLVATSFAFMLVGMTLLVPFHLQKPHYALHVASAAYVECQGEVYLDGVVCPAHTLFEVIPGITIQTKDHSQATILYDDYSVIRINEKTQAKVDDSSSEKIHVNSGNVWVNAPTEKGDKPLKVSTSVLKAKIPKGSVGVSTKANSTDLVSSTAVVEVQIDNPQGETEVVTVSPQKMVRVQKANEVTRVRQAQIVKTKDEWIEENTTKDIEYLQDVKKKTVQDNIALAGSLPGEVADFISKATRSAQTALTWNDQSRLQRRAGELDELLAEMIVLLEKGDKTTAQQTFEVYKQKFSSLTDYTSDKIAVKDAQNDENLVLAVLQKHTRLVSPFTSDDPQYILKEEITDLSVNLELPNQLPQAEVLAEEVVKQKLMEVHKTASEGKIALAEEMLLKAADSVETTVTSAEATNQLSSGLKILTEIGEQSEKLQPLVKEIKKKKVEKIKAMEPVAKDQTILTDYVTGTAYKEPSESDSREDEDDAKTSKVVGQAIKPEEESTL